MMQALHKRSEDLLDYFIDLKRWLERGEKIVDADAIVRDSTLAITRLEYADTGVLVWIASGGDGRHTVECRITTDEGKYKLFRFAVLTRGNLVAAIDVDSVMAAVGPEDTEEGKPVPGEAFAVVRPRRLEFAYATPGTVSPAQTVLLYNLGDDGFAITGISVTGDFSQVNNCPATLGPGEHCTITTRYKPSTGGSPTGTLTIQTTAQTRMVALEADSTP